MRIRKIAPAAILLGSSLFLAAHAPRIRADEDPRVIEIVAKRFEFAPSTITLKRGETVKLRVNSQDVTHGFFSRALHLDADLVPGRAKELLVTPETAGTFVAICHHFCGAQHGSMKMTIVVE